MQEHRGDDGAPARQIVEVGRQDRRADVRTRPSETAVSASPLKAARFLATKTITLTAMIARQT